MNAIKFGSVVSFRVSPALVLLFAGQLEEWLVQLSEQESIDVEREAIGMAQQLLVFLTSNTNDKEEI